eukprot:1571186-Prymnesium_polylepis.1
MPLEEDDEPDGVRGRPRLARAAALVCSALPGAKPWLSDSTPAESIDRCMNPCATVVPAAPALADRPWLPIERMKLVSRAPHRAARDKVGTRRAGLWLGAAPSAGRPASPRPTLRATTLATTAWPQEITVVSKGPGPRRDAMQMLSAEARALVRGEMCLTRSRNRSAEVSRAALAAMH